MGKIDIGGAFIVIAIIGVIIGIFLAFVAPFFWDLISPFLHSVTAP